MTAKLINNVFVENEGLGQVYEAGTKATAELRKLIPNPAAWSDSDGEDDAEEPSRLPAITAPPDSSNG